MICITCNAVFSDQAVVMTAKVARELNHERDAAAETMIHRRRCVSLRLRELHGGGVQGSDQRRCGRLSQNTQASESGFDWCGGSRRGRKRGELELLLFMERNRR